MLVTDILARLRSDTSGFNSGMASASRALQGFQSESKAANVALQGLGTAAKMAAGAATMAITAASTSLIGMGVKGLQASASMEQLKISMIGIFEGTGKSAQEAQDYLDRLAKFAAKTPFEFASLAETSKKLMAVGYEGDQVIEMLETMGNAAAAAGKGSDAVLRLANALQRAKGSGRLTGETIMMMSEAMPTFNARGAIAAKLFGGDMTAAMKALESATLPVDDAINAMMEGMQELAGAEGAMERQSRTLIGIMSTFKDEVDMAMVKGLEPALPALEGALTKMIEPVASFTQNFGKALGPAIANLTNQAAPAIIELAEVLGPVLGKIISGLGPILAAILPVLNAFIAGFGSIMDVVFQPLSLALSDLMKPLQAVALQLVPPLIQAFEALVPAIYPLKDGLTAIMSVILPLIPAFLELVLAIVPVISYILRVTGASIDLWNQMGILQPAIYGLVGAFVALKVIRAVSTAMQAASIAMQVMAGNAVAAGTATKAYGIGMRIATALTWLQTAAQMALNAAMMLNPITWIVLAIVALIAALVLAYQKVDWFRNFVDKAWDAIKNAVKTAIEWMTEMIPKALDFIKNAFLKYHPYGIIISNWDKIIAFFKALPSKMLQFGIDIVMGIINGLKSLGGKLLQTFKDLVTNPVDTIKSILGIASPSKVMHAMGEDFSQGFANGINKVSPRAAEAAADMAYKAANAAKTVSELRMKYLTVDIMNGIIKTGMDAAGRSYAAMAAVWSKAKEFGPKEELLAYQMLGFSPKKAAKEAEAAVGAATAGAGGAGAAKRLTDIYVFGKLMGRNYGKGFGDGYKTVRDVSQTAVDALKESAQGFIEAAKDIAKSMRDFGSFMESASPYVGQTDAFGFAASMQQRLDVLNKFNEALAELSTMGLDKSIFADIVKAGPMQGLGLAQTLIAGGLSGVMAINDMQAALMAASKQTGRIFAESQSGLSMEYLRAQAGMQVNFEKDSIKITVGAGASAEDAAMIRKAVVKAIDEALKRAKKAELAG